MKACSGINRFYRSLLISAAISAQSLWAEQTNEFSYSFGHVETNLVILKCESGGTAYHGCGFIAEMDGATYLFTSQHTILGADKIRFLSPAGRTIKPRSIEIANERNVARMALSKGEALGLSPNPSMGARVGVFGSTPDQLQASLYGTITGVGADVVEVSADFTEEHSGSPVLNPEKEVIGIASYVRESSRHAMKKGTKFENKTRRFCYRLDGSNWKSVNWKRFNQTYGTVHRESNTFIDGLVEILNSWSEEPFDPIRFEDEPERALVNWASDHNEVVGNGIRGASFNRKQYAEYSDSTRKLADVCRSRAKKIRMLSEQRGLTEFLYKEYDMQAGTLEYFAKIIDHYTTSTDY